jgi:hypothetical protein
MTVITCPIRGTYLVRDETRIPVGKSPVDVSTTVWEYSYGWVCAVHGYGGQTSRPECLHVQAAQHAAAATPLV